MLSDFSQKPRVGIPYRTRKEELTGERDKYERYCDGVRRAGGDPVEVSLALSPDELKKTACSLDAFVLPGSPADVEPSRFHAARNPECGDPDPNRETTDLEVLPFRTSRANFEAEPNMSGRKTRPSRFISSELNPDRVSIN